MLAELPDAFHERTAGLLAWPPEPPEPTGGLVAVLAAGTSDLPVAKEAELTARYLGRQTELTLGTQHASAPTTVPPPPVHEAGVMKSTSTDANVCEAAELTP